MITAIALIAIVAIHTANCIVCTEHPEGCLQIRETARITAIKEFSDFEAHILEALHMQNYNDTVRAPGVVNAEFDVIMRKLERKERQDELKGNAERVFVLAVDPSNLMIPAKLVAHFPVSNQTKGRRILKVGVEIAAKTVQLKKSRRISIELRPENLHRWWNENAVEGVTVEAILNGENIAVHPQNMRRSTENMFLSLHLRPIFPTRSRRQVLPVCTRSMNETGCCLYDLLLRTSDNRLPQPRESNDCGQNGRNGR
ncbi:unnamed protein product [Strongylus vulgaris]|uniref:TGF-beta propeptide domain-containing protein n=1 Tax=Strongylus vulgaris TaxID=40348 RepID=A0A3P7L636_STRVU|nr:unnamed protein product [Strongylus vulgaris]